MHYLLMYDVVPDYVQRRAAFRDAHLALGRAAVARGELVLGGALADPPDGAVLLFQGPSPAAAEAFAAADPYVRNGLVTRWRVREWTTVVGPGAATPIAASPPPAAPMFAANDELALHVPDPAAAEPFYVRVLGCEVTDRTPDCISLRSGVRRLYLLRDPTGSHEAVVPSFDVPDRAAALATLQAAGCTLVPIGPHAPGEHYVRDPHGVLFDVIEGGA
jgi:uncharacterized protein YciI/catechol 2,3-dioxygenase-like lactoylglutathione lyase family enzyme